MVARDDKQRSVVHQSALFCLLKEVLQRLVYPIYAAHRNIRIAAHVLGHLVPAQAGVGIRLVHIQRLCHHHQTVVLRLRTLKHFQRLCIHHIVMEAPAARTSIALLFEIFLRIVFAHTELLRIFAQLVGIILARRIHKNAAHTCCLHAAEQRRRALARDILIHNQMRAEGRIQALRRRHSRGIVAVQMRIFYHQTIEERRSLFGNIAIIVVDIIAVHGFKNQQHHAVILRLDFGNPGLRIIYAQLCYPRLVLRRQLTLLHVLPAGNLIGIKQGLAHKVDVNRHRQHIAVVHTRLFVLYLDIHADKILHAIHARIAKQPVRQIQRHSKHRHAQQRPRKVRLAALRLRHIKQQQNHQDTDNNPGNQRIAHRRENALHRIDIEVLEEHAFYVHRGLPKIKGIKDYRQRRKNVDEEVHALHQKVRILMVAHRRQQHQKNIIIDACQHRQRRLQALIQAQLINHKEAVRQIQHAHDDNRHITQNSVRHALTPVIKQAGNSC